MFVGVPEIAQLPLFKLKPAGKGGLAEQDVKLLPVRLAEIVVIAVPAVKVKVEPV
ncbi:hypothetical protein LPTSP4_19460 [Leptospira ryugenii]|uniref:Uncharacterized protein n=1 Tax=Leptospira ryugenii TaxID=1917863 RepID=A0A2P2E0L8_9LEPT|nr:hypothetical protein LPTSP4_19460 [Leptospira ryugenii]